MTAQSTPGPWRVENGHIDSPEPFRFVATVNFYNPDWRANEALIAAAPELLASVKDLLEQHKGSCKIVGRRDTCIVTREAEAAIAKAEGRDS